MSPISYSTKFLLPYQSIIQDLTETSPLDVVQARSAHVSHRFLFFFLVPLVESSMEHLLDWPRVQRYPEQACVGVRRKPWSLPWHAPVGGHTPPTCKSRGSWHVLQDDIRRRLQIMEVQNGRMQLNRRWCRLPWYIDYHAVALRTHNFHFSAYIFFFWT